MTGARRGRLRRAAAAMVATMATVTFVAPAPGRAAPAGGGPERAVSALFALIVGVNAPAEPELQPLRFADDDAARYLDLFRALGARTYLLTRLDDNTRRLHPQAAAEALPPRRDELRRTVDAVARDIARARAEGVATVLYVAYAGHGSSDGAGAYLTLEDGRLDGAELLAGVVRRIGADRSHLLIDACNADLLAFERGPGGGERRPVRGFVELEAAARRDSVGLLLARSLSGESHEWEGFQAGVFSHEVRSGLYGAADADGDGQITYGELAAFVARSNAAIANERFRPQLIARPPRGTDLLVDVTRSRAREMRFDGPDVDAHYLIEDARGDRLIDFHGSAGTPIRLVRPAVAGPLFVRRLPDGMERTVPPSGDVVQLDALPGEPAPARTRGAAHQAFGQLFALPFDRGVVGAYEEQAEAERAAWQAEQARDEEGRTRSRRRRIAGYAAIGAGVGAAVAGAAFLLAAHDLHDAAPPGEDQRATLARNDRIRRDNLAGVGGAVAGGAAIGVGLTLLLLDRAASGGADRGSATGVAVGALAGGWTVGVGGSF